MNQPKYKLRFRPEWGVSAPLWAADDVTRNAFGGSYFINPQDLPLAPGTIAQLEQLCAWYQAALNWDYPPDPGPWQQAECDHFNAAVLTLFEKVAAELGEDFAVINAHKPVHEDPDLDAYLKDPKGFHRQQS